MYCPNCFSVLQPGVTRCSHCGFDTREYAHSTDALPLYTSLNDQYMIGRVLGQGGFGITYKALDTFKNRVVAIKEYMPSNYAQRTGCQVVPIPGDTKATRIFEHGKISYIDEIKTLYQFENVQGIVQIFTHFQENNTAYLVMEYLDGRNLKAYVKSHGGRLDPPLAGNYIVKAARARNKCTPAIFCTGTLARRIFIFCLAEQRLSLLILARQESAWKIANRGTACC